MSQAQQQHSFIVNLRRWAWSMEMLPAIALLSFLASISINAFIFLHWKLNFLEIASPSDVAMSGFSTLASALPLIFTFGVAVAFSNALKFEIIFRGVYFILLFIVLCVPAVELLQRFHMMQHMISDTALLYILTGGVLAMFGISIDIPLLGDILVHHSWLKIPILCTVMLPMAVSTHQIQVRGYFDRQLVAIPEQPLQNCPTPVLLWMGERAMVVQCTKKTNTDKDLTQNTDSIMVLRGFDKVVLRRM